MITIKQLKKEIKGIFIPLKKSYYFGPLTYGCPYYWPRGFNKNIITIRKLILKPEEKYQQDIKDRPWLNTPENKYINIPRVRRSKDWIIKNYYIEIGTPIKIAKVNLGWKDKFETPRFEWAPSWHLYFFKWQFCIFWKPPVNNEDRYFEMILWYLYYADKDIKKAEQTWGWVDYDTKKSTWNNEYLIKLK